MRVESFVLSFDCRFRECGSQPGRHRLAGLCRIRGYLRPSGFFPSPWLRAANVVSQTPSGQSLDTGAVRIDNPGATPVTISGFNVTFGGGQSFSIWNPLTIGPG